MNAEIANTLGAEIVFVATPGTDNPTQLKERIEVACSNFGGTKNKSISGVIINKLNALLMKLAVLVLTCQRSLMMLTMRNKLTLK